MRILLFPSAYAPGVGGVEELTARLAARLIASGDEVEVWTNRHPRELAAHEEIDGVTVRRFALPLPRLAVAPLLRLPGDLRRAAEPLLDAALRFRPDVVHVQCFSANGGYATWLANRLRVPLVLTLQGETLMDDRDIYDHSLTLRLALRWGVLKAEVVTGCSRFVLDDAERRFGLERGRGVVVPNGVEVHGDADPEPLPIPWSRFVLGLGRIVEKKGFDLLLAAFERLAKRDLELGLVIGGDGPMRRELIAAAAAAGLEGRVAFPGTLSRGQVAWAMTKASAFVLPSRLEPFGIVALEALRAACPTIVTSRGGAQEIVRHGVDGLVVDPEDVDATASAILRVLSDRRLAADLRAAGPSRAATFSWDSIRARYAELYRTALTTQSD